jgi:hypothetical protein
VKSYACSPEVCYTHPPSDIAKRAKQGSALQWKFLPWRTQARDIPTAFNPKYVNNCKIKFCRQQSEVMKVIIMTIFAARDKPKPDTENIGGLDAVIKLTNCQAAVVA